jgi:catechol 2,3-dioxygenase-like lactoylglutathione lyase family enzyme
MSTLHIRATDFVTIPSRDLAVSSEFYGTTLGLRRSVYMPDRHFSEYETGNLTLSVVNPAGMGFEHHISRNPLALHVDDVAAARAELEARGVTFAGDTIDTGVCHMAFFHDLDGNALMLHHRYARRVTEQADQSGL